MLSRLPCMPGEVEARHSRPRRDRRHRAHALHDRSAASPSSTRRSTAIQAALDDAGLSIHGHRRHRPLRHRERQRAQLCSTAWASRICASSPACRPAARSPGTLVLAAMARGHRARPTSSSAIAPAIAASSSSHGAKPLQGGRPWAKQHHDADRSLPVPHPVRPA